jgi:tetratricopeptide (TPR) repeat protein
VRAPAGFLALSLLTSPALAQAGRPVSTPQAPSVKALVQLARKQMQAKSPALALQTLGKALPQAPNSEEVLAAYAEAAIAARAPVKALPALEALCRMAPREAGYRSSMGTALLQMGDAEAAAAVLREAERLDPDDPATLVALGAALNRQGRFAEAVDVLLRALTRDPEALPALAARAEAEAGLGEKEAADARAQRVLARSPADGTASYVLGVLRLQQQKYVEARGALEKAAAALPEIPAVHERLASACEGAGDAVCAGRERELARQREKEREARVKEARRLVGFEPETKAP